MFTAIILFLKTLNPKVWLYFAITAILMFGAYKAYSYAYNNGSDDRGAKDDKKYALVIALLKKQIETDREMYNQSILDASKQQSEWMSKYQLAETKANEAQKQLQVISIKSDSLVKQLRDTTDQATKRASLPETTDTARIEYISILSGVFNDCTAKYSELAIEARRSGINEQKLIDSYPTQ